MHAYYDGNNWLARSEANEPPVGASFAGSRDGRMGQARPGRTPGPVSDGPGKELGVPVSPFSASPTPLLSRLSSSVFRITMHAYLPTVFYTCSRVGLAGPGGWGRGVEGIGNKDYDRTAMASIAIYSFSSPSALT